MGHRLMMAIRVTKATVMTLLPIMRTTELGIARVRVLASPALLAKLVTMSRYW